MQNAKPFRLLPKQDVPVDPVLLDFMTDIKDCLGEIAGALGEMADVRTFYLRKKGVKEQLFTDEELDEILDEKESGKPDEPEQPRSSAA